jgi:GLPGLI family protein
MYRNYILFWSFFFIFQYVQAQTEIDIGHIAKVVYQQSYNGQVEGNQNPIWLYTDKDFALITSRDQILKQATYPYEMTIVDHKNGHYNLFAFLNDQDVIAMLDTSSIKNQVFEFSDETKEIMGYTCKKARTNINSNTIDLWYTNEFNMKGSPVILGQELGLVLEYVRNGNFSITAKDLKNKSIKLPAFITESRYELLDKITYQDRLWKSRFTTIPLFNRQQIHFSDTGEHSDNVMRFANGTVAVTKVKFPLLKSHDQIFLDLTEQSNGDAYDRTGSVFMIPMDKKISFLDGLRNGVDVLPIFENGNGKRYQGVVTTDSYDAPVELMRFFTPFGIKHFNSRITLKGKVWQDSVLYRQDISQFASLLSGKEVYIGVFIGNYDRGGHIVTGHITIHNDEGVITPLKQTLPLFNTVNVMEMAGQEYSTMFDKSEGLTVTFKLVKPLKNAQLIYTTTGHGGWENGDEFVPKKNTILLDKKIVFDLTPWRTDCGSYRLYNPVSGNFSNGLSSSDYSRSNWCPGTVTNPFIIDLGNLSAGKHTIQVKIPQGKPEGNSFSAWNVSGVIIGD